MFCVRPGHVTKAHVLLRLRVYPRLYSTNAAEPLRILFCGSDHFSIKSLEALNKEHQADKSFIESIDAVCRPAKRTGRGLKTLKEVPIKQAAQDQQLTIHELDTFRDWQLPARHGRLPNLIVAVSFGLFIPKRILLGAQYGGVNVHPSLLPDLRGAAPIQHAIIQDRKRFGVTVQTLHTEKFDHGHVLAQTVSPLIPEPPAFEAASAGALTRSLENELADVGAATLVEALRRRAYMIPYGDVLHYTMDGAELRTFSNTEWSNATPETSKQQHAPKITAEDRRISWQSSKWRDLQLRHGALGQLWDDTTYAACHPTSTTKRVIFQSLEPLNVVPSLDQESNRSISPGKPGLYVGTGQHAQRTYQPYEPASLEGIGKSDLDKLRKQLAVGIATSDPEVPFLEVKECTVESGAHGKGQAELLTLLLKRASSVT